MCMFLPSQSTDSWVHSITTVSNSMPSTDCIAFRFSCSRKGLASSFCMRDLSPESCSSNLNDLKINAITISIVSRMRTRYFAYFAVCFHLERTLSLLSFAAQCHQLLSRFQLHHSGPHWLWHLLVVDVFRMIACCDFLVVARGHWGTLHWFLNLLRAQDPLMLVGKSTCDKLSSELPTTVTRPAGNWTIFRIPDAKRRENNISDSWTNFWKFRTLPKKN